ncbi:hypothetical protein ACS5PN_17220 [Roseateles sp. NT4]
MQSMTPKAGGARTTALYRHAEDSSFLGRPLCTWYACATFKTVRFAIADDRAVRVTGWVWSLGLLEHGQYEVLGVWPAGTASTRVAQDLRERGVEWIEAIAAESDADIESLLPDAAPWPSVAAVSSDDPFNRLSTFDLRHAAALEAAVATAERLQRSVVQAVKRRGCFADEAAAVAFLARTLQNIDRTLY